MRTMTALMKRRRGEGERETDRERERQRQRQRQSDGAWHGYVGGQAAQGFGQKDLLMWEAN